jgi:hypothetical protein
LPVRNGFSLDEHSYTIDSELISVQMNVIWFCRFAEKAVKHRKDAINLELPVLAISS